MERQGYPVAVRFLIKERMKGRSMGRQTLNWVYEMALRHERERISQREQIEILLQENAELRKKIRELSGEA